MSDEKILRVRADVVSLGTFPQKAPQEVLAIFDLSSTGVYPEKLALVLLPEEARDFAQRLIALAATVESGLSKPL